jgi:hypothetical protein
MPSHRSTLTEGGLGRCELISSNEKTIPPTPAGLVRTGESRMPQSQLMITLVLVQALYPRNQTGTHIYNSTSKENIVIPYTPSKPSYSTRTTSSLSEHPPHGQLVILQLVPDPGPSILPLILRMFTLLVFLTLGAFERRSSGSGGDEFYPQTKCALALATFPFAFVHTPTHRD